MFQNPYAKCRILDSCLLLWWQISYKFRPVLMTNFIQISSSSEETDVLLEADTHPSSRDQTIGQPSGRPPNSWWQNRYSKPHCLFVRYHTDESLYIRYKSMQLSLIININAMCCQMIVNTNNIIGLCPYLSSMAMAKTKRKKI